MIGDKDQAVFRPQVGQMLHPPSVYPWARQQPREVDHKQAIPEDKERSSCPEQTIGDGEPKALDGRYILELFWSGTNHIAAEMDGGVFPLSGMMALG